MTDLRSEVSGPRRPVTQVRAVAVRPTRHIEVPERVITEEPLEVRVAGPGQAARSVAVTMRTPGHDFELAAGFLLTEALIGYGEVLTVGYCLETEQADQRFNTVTVRINRPWTAPQVQRDFKVSSSCGVCGKTSLDQVALACPTLQAGPVLAASLISELPDRLRRAQRLFDQTGGVHAAGLFGYKGELHCLREDVGRHNAVDKVVGWGLLAKRAPAAGAVLMVSGRVSFEIVQKAALGGIAVVAAVSAPSSLAVDAANRLGVTLAGFVRGEKYNIYSHPERIALDG